MDYKEDQITEEIDPLMKQSEGKENIEMQQIAEKSLISCSLLTYYVL